MNANSINHIIERGHCVCGTPIEKETPEYQSLLREKEYLPPQSIGLMIRQFTQSLNSMKNNGDRYVEHVTHTHEDILNLDVQIGETEEHLKVLSEELKGIDSVHALEVEVQKYEGFERECLQKKGANNNQIDALEKRKTKLTTKLSNLAANTKTNRKIQEKIKYVEGVRQWFEDSYNRQSFELREDLEKRVNHYFQEMYHGNRVVEIDDRYRVTLKVKNDIRQDTEIDGSQGLETVKNFAFLAGLADLAEHKKLQDKKNDEGITAVESLPMILDAPFSNTDDTHVSNISRVLPQVSEQLILIVMQKDFTHAETVMSKHIGKKYRFVKKSETHTEIEEVSL
ncbi:hypothetical protein [Savagea faecisuis]|uniref:Uncharacterized protein n=1 Tax=Savagea faecisuis TaxID=1274803 RepID=A0ABW3GWU6_9BACL